MATISKAGICNLAFGNISHKSTIENVDTEQSAEARQCRLWYDVARRQALADYNWGFARRRLAVALHNDDPPAEWAYRYQYPADAVALREIENPLGPLADAIPYDVELSDDGSTRSILTDAEEAVVVYTRDLETTTMFPPHFVVALSYLLAFYIAGPFTGQKSVKGDMWKAYQGMIGVGSAHDANQSVQRAPREAPWISGRQ